MGYNNIHGVLITREDISKSAAQRWGVARVGKKKLYFHLRINGYSTYGRVRAMRESIRGEDWTVVGQTMEREGGKIGQCAT